MTIGTKEILSRLRSNKAVRFLIFPGESLYRKLLQAQYLRSKDSQMIKTLRCKYQGERCFVIGNGPSLTPEDLDRLAGEKTFAANRIYHIFERTKWRPTFYVSVDNDVIMTEIDRIKNSGSYMKLINYKAKKYGREGEDNLWYINVNGPFRIDKRKMNVAQISTDVSHHCSAFGSVTANAIELAIYMGFTEIYLLGVDHNYPLKLGMDGKVYRDPSVTASYFAGMKDDGSQMGNSQPVMYVEAITDAYVQLKKFAEENGVRIYNATRGGKLEVYPRMNFDKVIGTVCGGGVILLTDIPNRNMWVCSGGVAA